MSTTVLATASAMPKTIPAAQLQPNAARDDGAEHRRDSALRDRARNGDAADGQQLFDMELQADAEHQENDADFGELFGDLGVGDKSRACADRPACPRGDSRR